MNVLSPSGTGSLACKDQFGLTVFPRVKRDVLSLGGMTIRENSGTIPYRRARFITLDISGAEYNLAANLSDCFGLRTAHACPFIKDNPETDIVQFAMRSMGVEGIFHDFQYDGVTGPFYARTMSDEGWPGRPPRVQYRRGAKANEAAAFLKPGDFDWDTILSEGVRLVHSSGLFASLSESTTTLVLELFRAAKKRGITTSLDLNYRELLWKVLRGGQSVAIDVCRQIVALTDILLGNESDFQNALGIHGPTVERASDVDPAAFEGIIEALLRDFPNVKVVATSIRGEGVHYQKWSGAMAACGKFYRAPVYDLEVYDRIGGGDGFAAGLIYGILMDMDPQAALHYAWAHGALVATTPGDTTMVSLEQVVNFVRGQSQRVSR